MKKKKEFQVPSKKQPVYRVFKVFMRLLFKKPQIINLAGDLPDKSIIVANHSAKSGPPGLDMYYPVFCAKWGAYQMFGNTRAEKLIFAIFCILKRWARKRDSLRLLRRALWQSFRPMFIRE